MSITLIELIMYIHCLSAHMHKKDSSGESNVESVVVQPNQPPCLPTELFSHAVHIGVENVYNEPRHRLSCSVNGSGVLQCAEIVLGAGEAAMSEILYPRFGSIISGNIINQAEREELFCRFHSLRMDTSLREDVVGLIQKLDPNVPRKYCVMFHQCFLRELVACTIKAYRELVTRPEETAASKDLTASEKGVLYYVAGFILHKVGTRKHGNTALIQSCVSNKKESRFAEWTAKLDRGGLKFPSDNFFELIYQCDRCVASRVGTKLSPNVLCKDSTMEALMDHPQIKNVWDKICTSAGQTYANSLVTLQYTLEAFLAMKGRALAQQARAPLMRTGKATNLSLRHGLLINW